MIVTNLILIQTRKIDSIHKNIKMNLKLIIFSQNNNSKKRLDYHILRGFLFLVLYFFARFLLSQPLDFKLLSIYIYYIFLNNKTCYGRLIC